MPVHDAETHELVKITEATPYGGCCNPDRKKHYFTFTGQLVEDRGSEHCRYDKRATDPRCGECKRPSDEDYLRSYGL